MNLTEQKAKQFFETMSPLVEWLKETEAGKEAIERDNEMSIEGNVLLLSLVWERPEYIDEYINEKGNVLSDEEWRILRNWREHYVHDTFFIERFTRNGAVFIATKTGMVYLVSGIAEDLKYKMKNFTLPCIVETTLLPYAGRIVFDALMVQNVKIRDQKTIRDLGNRYEEAKKRNQLIKKLPSKIPMEKSEMRKTFINLQKPSREELLSLINEEAIPYLIKDSELEEIKDLLGKDSRNPDDWNRISDILEARFLVTLDLEVKYKNITSIKQILCVSNRLFLFTTPEECYEYLQNLNRQGHPGGGFNLCTFNFFEVAMLADELGLTIEIDPPYFKSGPHTFLEYDPETKRLYATIHYD